MPVYTHEHNNGEVYTAVTVEQAHLQCPKLGEMALQDVKRLLELQAMGQELLAEKAKPDKENRVQPETLRDPNKFNGKNTTTTKEVTSATAEISLPLEIVSALSLQSSDEATGQPVWAELDRKRRENKNEHTKPVAKTKARRPEPDIKKPASPPEPKAIETVVTVVARVADIVPSEIVADTIEPAIEVGRVILEPATEVSLDDVMTIEPEEAEEIKELVVDEDTADVLLPLEEDPIIDEGLEERIDDIDETAIYWPVPEVETDRILWPESLSVGELHDELVEYLEPLEPVEAKTAETLVNAIIQTAQEIREFVDATDADIAVAEEHIKDMCIQLCELLELDYDDAIVEKFVRIFIESDALSETELKNINIFIGEGTHEQRQNDYHLLWLLTQIVRRPSQPPINWLGRFALQIGLVA